MRKMIAVVLLSCVSGAAASFAVFAQPPATLPPNASEEPRFYQPAPTPFAPPAVSPATAVVPTIPATPKESWKADFTRVVTEIVELLDEEELESEFARLERRASELKARNKLRNAVKELQEIITDHPDTDAAETAQALLGVSPPANADDAAVDDSGDAPVSEPDTKSVLQGTEPPVIPPPPR